MRSRGEEATGRDAGQKARRRPVKERTYSWLNRLRSLLTRWTKLAASYEATLRFVCGFLAHFAAGSS